jgi:uncharacterized protein YndB with AHSA1/START domain
MTDILHRITIQAPPEKIADAVSTADGIRSWWTEDCDVTPSVGAVDVFRFIGGAVEFHFRVDELGPKRIAWTCVPGEKTPPEWLPTKITFDMRPGADGTTQLDFAHRGWRSADGDLPQCNTVWGELMHRLKDSAEGKPRGPYFTGRA